MMGGGGNGNRGAAQGGRQSAQGVHRVFGRALWRGENVAGPPEEIVGGVLPSAPFPPGHGMAAHKKQAMFPAEGQAGIHNGGLDTADIGHDAAWAQHVQDFPQHRPAGPGRKGQNHQIRLGHGGGIRHPFDGAGLLHPSDGSGIQVGSKHTVSAVAGEGLGHGTADQAQADNRHAGTGVTGCAHHFPSRQIGFVGRPLGRCGTNGLRYAQPSSGAAAKLYSDIQENDGGIFCFGKPAGRWGPKPTLRCEKGPLCMVVINLFHFVYILPFSCKTG